MPDDLYGVPDCVVAAKGSLRYYMLRVGSATSRLQTDSSWCGDERDKACYLLGLEGQRPTCTYDTDWSGKINKLKSLELFEAGLQRGRRRTTGGSAAATRTSLLWIYSTRGRRRSGGWCVHPF